MTVTFTPASDVTIEELVAAFNTGYAGYTVPVQLENDLMLRHIAQNNINLAASRLAHMDGEIVGVGLLARREQRGWIGGMGIHSAHRGQGIGRQLMNALLDSARSMALAQVQLEVIEGNDAAFNLYKSLGFEVTRRLLILQCVRLHDVDAAVPVRSIPAEEALHYYEEFHSVPNPWQRERESLQVLAAGMTGWLAGEDDHPVAYAIGHSSGRVVNLADVGFRIGEESTLRGLIAYVHRQQPGASAQLANLGEDDPSWPVLSTLGYEPSMSQFEMKIVLDQE